MLNRRVVVTAGFKRANLWIFGLFFAEVVRKIELWEEKDQDMMNLFLNIEIL